MEDGESNHLKGLLEASIARLDHAKGWLQAGEKEVNRLQAIIHSSKATPSNSLRKGASKKGIEHSKLMEARVELDKQERENSGYRETISKEKKNIKAILRLIGEYDERKQQEARAMAVAIARNARAEARASLAPPSLAHKPRRLAEDPAIVALMKQFEGLGGFKEGGQRQRQLRRSRRGTRKN